MSSSLSFTGSPAGELAIRQDAVLDDVLHWLGILFDRMPAGIAVFSPELVLLCCNPDWARSVSQRLSVPLGRVRQGALVVELFPGSEAALAPLLERALAGEPVRQDAARLESQLAGQTDTLVSY